MNEHLTRPESLNIGAELRLRLEGRVELLEDAVPLLDSVLPVLSREIPSDDELVTLREAINQWPRFEEALEAAKPHASLEALCEVVIARMERIDSSLSELLEKSVSSTRAGLQVAVARLMARRPPAKDETIFGPTRTSFSTLLLTLALIAGVTAALEHVGLEGWWCCAVPAALVLAFDALYRGRTEQLLGDRLYLGGENLWLRDVIRVDRGTIHTTVATATRSERFGNGYYPLISMIRSLNAEGLSSRPTAMVTRLWRTSKIVAAEGTLTIHNKAFARAVKRLNGHEDLTGPQLVALLAHLPVGRLEPVALALRGIEGVHWSPR